jgi:hypothetical protein
MALRFLPKLFRWFVIDNNFILVVHKIVVTLPALQAGIHDASHRGWNGLPRADVLEAGVGGPPAAQAGAEAAVESLAPTIYEDALGCNAVPMP